MHLYEYTMPSGARIVGYLRDPDDHMPDYKVRPGVLIIPGGGYDHCGHREGDPVAMNFLNAGYQVFILTYTTANATPAPLGFAPLRDAAGAILHLRRNAAALNLDPHRLAVCGFSAGGHLAASVALLAHRPEVCADLGAEASQLRPDAVILGYPVITSGDFAHKGSIANLAGDDRSLWELFSLEKQVQPGMPPFFLWHTVEDDVVPVQNTLLLVGALQACHVPYELHLFPHGAHGSSTCHREVNHPNPHNATWLPLCIGWLADVFDFHL